MLSEYHVVRLRSSISAISVPIGTRGAVLIVFDDTPPAYEVELFENLGNSLRTFTLQESDLEHESDLDAN